MQLPGAGGGYAVSDWHGDPAGGCGTILLMVLAVALIVAIVAVGVLVMR